MNRPTYLYTDTKYFYHHFVTLEDQRYEGDKIRRVVIHENHQIHSAAHLMYFLYQQLGDQYLHPQGNARGRLLVDFYNLWSDIAQGMFSEQRSLFTPRVVTPLPDQTKVYAVQGLPRVQQTDS